MSNKMRCGRRDDFGVKDDGETDTWRKDNTCSYCGSMHPDDVFKAIEAGEKICPTDKNYKIYVADHKKFYFQHFSEEDKAKFIEVFNAKKINFDYPGGFYRWPFFIAPVK